MNSTTITIVQKRAIELQKGDIVGDESRAFYLCLQDANRASRAQGCQVLVQYADDGGRSIREWDSAEALVPVRVEA